MIADLGRLVGVKPELKCSQGNILNSGSRISPVPGI